MVQLTRSEEGGDKIVLCRCLYGHQVHTVSAADVPRLQPVSFGTGIVSFISRKPVGVASVGEMTWS